VNNNTYVTLRTSVSNRKWKGAKRKTIYKTVFGESGMELMNRHRIVDKKKDY